MLIILGISTYILDFKPVVHQAKAVIADKARSDMDHHGRQRRVAS